MDTPDQLCLWRIEATVGLMFTVVTSGELFVSASLFLLVKSFYLLMFYIKNILSDDKLSISPYLDHHMPVRVTNFW